MPAASESLATVSPCTSRERCGAAPCGSGERPLDKVLLPGWDVGVDHGILVGKIQWDGAGAREGSHRPRRDVAVAAGEDEFVERGRRTDSDAHVRPHRRPDGGGHAQSRGAAGVDEAVQALRVPKLDPFSAPDRGPFVCVLGESVPQVTEGICEMKRASAGPMNLAKTHWPLTISASMQM